MDLVSTLSGFAVGAIVGATGVGGGSLMTPLLVLVMGVSPATVVAGLGHASMGAVDWGLLGSLLLSSLPGVYLGSAVSRKLPERLLRTLRAAMLVSSAAS